MSQQLSINFLQLMAKAEVPIEDAKWFHCIARHRGLHCDRDVLRFRLIQSMLDDRIRYG